MRLVGGLMGYAGKEFIGMMACMVKCLNVCMYIWVGING